MQECQPSGQDYGLCPGNCNTWGALLGYADPPHPRVQEDTDSMQKELEMWRAENTRHSEAMKKEEGYVGVAAHRCCDCTLYQ